MQIKYAKKFNTYLLKSENIRKYASNNLIEVAHSFQRICMKLLLLNNPDYNEILEENFFGFHFYQI